MADCSSYAATSSRSRLSTRGGLKGDTRQLEWEYYDPAVAPELQLITTPLNRPDGTPAYCSDSLEWQKEAWSAPGKEGLFEGMSHAFYAMLYRTLTQGVSAKGFRFHIEMAKPKRAQAQSPSTDRSSSASNTRTSRSFAR